MKTTILPAVLTLLAACGSDAPESARVGNIGGGSGSGGSSAAGGSGGNGGGSAGSAGSAGASGSAGTTAEGTTLRIASYNTENFFNDAIDSGANDEQESTPSSEDYQTELANMAALLNRMDADIVLLQEVENRATLNDLADHTDVQRDYAHRVLIEGNDGRGIDVAALSTIPVQLQKSHADETFERLDVASETYRYARDALELHFNVNGQAIVLLNVHFRSKAFDDPDKRMAEAQHTRAIADALLAEDATRGLIIGGDFNDDPGSDPVLALEGEPQKCVCEGPRLVSTVRMQSSSDDHWTLFTSAQRKHVDDLLMSSVLQDLLVPGSAEVLHDSDLDSELGPLSDHSPVLATFFIPD